ncbi:MAG: hypothetical protein JWM93_3158, partial [Frankiales bacterium]|nr:hypothetical protein [Frankiales bacterium]
SKSAKIPLTITNGLDQDVHGLSVRLIADNSAYLPDVRAEAVDVTAHDKQQINLVANVKAIGSVRFGVVVRLLTPDGQVLSSVPLQVHSAGSGGKVLFVTLALMGLLFLVVALRLVRRVWQYYSLRAAEA